MITKQQLLQNITVQREKVTSKGAATELELDLCFGHISYHPSHDPS